VNELAKEKLLEKTECPQQEVCEDFYPSEQSGMCVHFDMDEFGNIQCHIQYDDEEWDIENE